MRRLPTGEPFAHAGRAGDPDLRRLVDAPLPPEPCVYVLRDDEPTLYAPPDAVGDLAGVEGTVHGTGANPTRALPDALPGEGVVHAPRHLPHDAALRVAARGAEPGTAVDWLRDELVAELAAHGVEPPAGATLVAGTGLARRERPRTGGEATLAEGHAVVVAPAARVPGVVALSDTLVVEGAAARGRVDAGAGVSASVRVVATPRRLRRRARRPPPRDARARRPG